jgi:hypothetical protein
MKKKIFIKIEYQTVRTEFDAEDIDAAFDVLSQLNERDELKLGEGDKGWIKGKVKSKCLYIQGEDIHLTITLENSCQCHGKFNKNKGV